VSARRFRNFRILDLARGIDELNGVKLGINLNDGRHV
jgi:hypothetical protein